MMHDAPVRRPKSNLPKGSVYGLLAVGILPALVPFLMLQSLVTVLANGIDVWLASLWPVMGASAVASTIVGVGLARFGLWYVWFIFVFGWLLIIGFLAGVLLAAVMLWGIVPGASPDLRFISIVNIVDWAVITPLAWVLLRTLRLRYWQPWTTPDQWEPPAPVPPTRTLLMTWANRKR